MQRVHCQIEILVNEAYARTGSYPPAELTWMHLGQPVSPMQQQDEITSKATVSSSMK